MMFKQKSVIVIGAGASKEINFPTGDELTDNISTLLKNSTNGRSLAPNQRALHDAIQLKCQQDNGKNGKNFYDEQAKYNAIRAHICESMPLAISIDNFIDNHKNEPAIELVGKLAIIQAILQAERSCSLNFARKNEVSFSGVRRTWYQQLMQLITEGCTVDELPERLSSLVLIIFNYDRCVEHFLINALMVYYKIDDAHAASLLREIEIYHPYGSIGPLPWQDAGLTVGFAEEPDGYKLLELVENIKTFTEGTDTKSSQIMMIRQRIHESSMILFLGFRFHRLNMQLLRAVRDVGFVVEEKRILATAYGISDADLKIIQDELFDLCSVDGEQEVIIRNDLKCFELFQEFSRTLSIS